MTRINGTYLSRIMFSILPLFIILPVLVTLIPDSTLTLLESGYLFMGMFVIYLLIDSITYFFIKRVTGLKVDGKFLYFNNKPISPNKIISIQFMEGRATRWSFPTIQFNYNNGDKIEVKRIIPRPQFFLSLKMNESIKILTEIFPDLKNKYIE
jgi:hypothetical protein